MVEEDTKPTVVVEEDTKPTAVVEEELSKQIDEDTWHTMNYRNFNFEHKIALRQVKKNNVQDPKVMQLFSCPTPFSMKFIQGSNRQV